MAAADILRMAGKSPTELNGKHLDAVYPAVPIFIQVEYNADIGIIFLMPTFF